MKHLYSVPNGSGWIKYARRAARYGAELRALGLAYDHPERVRARHAIRRGIEQARHEERKCAAARRIGRALAIVKTKKALAAA